MNSRISAQQDRVLTFIENNPGCCIADVCRYEWTGRGHAATYDRVNRLIGRGFISVTKVGSRNELKLTQRAPRTDGKI